MNFNLMLLILGSQLFLSDFLIGCAFWEEESLLCYAVEYFIPVNEEL